MSNEAVSANPLGTERTGKLMVRFAVPGIISFVVNSLYNMVDQIFIGVVMMVLFECFMVSLCKMFG